jgi:hypothetical protein
MAVNHFDHIQKVRQHEIFRTRVNISRQVHNLEERVFQATAETREGAEMLVREHMVDQSKLFNYLFFRPGDLLIAKAKRDIHDWGVHIHITYGTLRLPAETGRNNPSNVETRPDKFAADLALMGVEVQEMPSGPRGRGSIVRLDAMTGERVYVKSKSIFGEPSEDSIAAYRSLLEVVEKELEGFDATWEVGGVYNYPTNKKNSTGGVMYRATVVLLPFSKKDTIEYDRNRARPYRR